MSERPVHIGTHLYSLEALCGLRIGDEYDDKPMAYDIYATGPKVRYCKRCLRAVEKGDPRAVAELRAWYEYLDEIGEA